MKTGFFEDLSVRFWQEVLKQKKCFTSCASVISTVQLCGVECSKVPPRKDGEQDPRSKDCVVCHTPHSLTISATPSIAGTKKVPL